MSSAQGLLEPPREFEEYRPYTNIEQFRREMGKYWDAAEVARLEQYVRIGSR